MLRGARRQQLQGAAPRVSRLGRLAVDRESLSALRKRAKLVGVDEAAARRTRKRRRCKLGAAAGASERFAHALVGALTRYGPVTSSGIAAVMRHAWRRPKPIISALIRPDGME